MIRFNWKTLVRHTNNNPKKIVKYFELLTFELKISGIYRDIFNSKSIKNGFILNVAEVLLNKKKFTKEEICVYIYLCGLRNYVDYLTNNIKYLPIQYNTLDINNLEHNRLLIIKEDKIIFKYE